MVWIVAATDVALVALHLLTGLSVVSLDEESNLASWYSSLKLSTIALVSLALYAVRSPGSSGAGAARAWALNALLFLALSADEAASLHERFSRFALDLPLLAALRSMLIGQDQAKASHAWVALLLPVALALLAFFVVLACKNLEARPGLIALAFGGLACLALAMGLETLMLTWFPPLVDWGPEQVERYRVATTVEECGEILGATLLLSAFSLLLARRLSPGGADPGAAEVELSARPAGPPGPRG